MLSTGQKQNRKRKKRKGERDREKSKGKIFFLFKKIRFQPRSETNLIDQGRSPLSMFC